MSRAEYDIVIATADRPAMLSVSIPTFLRQSHPPRRLIIVDASDDHPAVAEAVRAATSGTGTQAELLRGPRSASIQRNLGLERIDSEVVFFPDDDSLWYPDVAWHVLGIYERDHEKQIGGVLQAAAAEPPHKLSQEEQRARNAGPVDRIKYVLAKMRFGVLNAVLTNPLQACGEELMRRHRHPSWLSELGARPAPFQIGFRMSYRADVARRYRFNEDLHPPRCGLEDFDLSFAAQQTHMLAEAVHAKVYHHKIGGGRGGARETGATQVLNLCYVVCRHTAPGSRPRRALRPYLQYMIWEHRLGRRISEYDREKLAAMRFAMNEIDWILEAPLEELTERYLKAFDRCLTCRAVAGNAHA